MPGKCYLLIHVAYFWRVMACPAWTPARRLTMIIHEERNKRFSTPDTPPLIKKPELLSPAGNLECFFAAIENGANAVYLGLKDFSARANAENLTLDDASKAIAYARQRSVKVYITLNTLVKTRELERVVDYLVALEELNPDALILQDLGLLNLMRSQFPQFHLHASTQMAIHNLAGVKQLKNMGFKRIVLARELSLDEISMISRNVPAETEVFVHGALCYSYSGLCFFSSMIGGRSGNRGQCAQPCRMCYKSQHGTEGYLFSMKDLLALPYIHQLMAAGVHSFKIEGRMKSPEYVAVVTNAYRQAIDGKVSDQNAVLHRIRTVFSRETAHSYVFENMINPLHPANRGSYAGEVIKAEKGFIHIRADADIGVRDLLQVFDNFRAKPSLLHVKTIRVGGKKVFAVKAGDTAVIHAERHYRRGARLYLLSSQKIKELFAPKIPKKLTTAKIPVSLEIIVRSNGIEIKGTAGYISSVRTYPVRLEEGIQKITQGEDIKECFSRLGETPFALAGFYSKVCGKLFVPLSVLNEIRRDYMQNLAEIWREKRDQRCEDIKKWIRERREECNSLRSISGEKGHPRYGISEDTFRLSLKIDKLDYLDAVPLPMVYKLYVVLTDETISHLQKNIRGIAGRLRVACEKIVFSLPPIIRDLGNGPGTYGSFKKTVHELISRGFKQFQISNPGAVGLFEGEDVRLYADYPLYCLNILSLRELKSLGFCRYTLSPEDGKDNLQTLFNPDTDTIVYQDTPLFISEACVWANMEKTCPGKSRCNFNRMMVENEHGDRFTAVNDGCKTVVIHEKPFSITHFIPELLESGQRDFRIDLCYRDYTPEMISDIFSITRNKGKVGGSVIGNFERGLV